MNAVPHPPKWQAGVVQRDSHSQFCDMNIESRNYSTSGSHSVTSKRECGFRMGLAAAAW
jgi:hypothetical protein